MARLMTVTSSEEGHTAKVQVKDGVGDDWFFRVAGEGQGIEAAAKQALERVGDLRSELAAAEAMLRGLLVR